MPCGSGVRGSGRSIVVKRRIPDPDALPVVHEPLTLVVEPKTIGQSQLPHGPPLILSVEGYLMIFLIVESNQTILGKTRVTEGKIGHSVPACTPVIVIEIINSLAPVTVTFSLVVGVQIPVETKLHAVGSNDLRNIVGNRRYLRVFAESVTRPTGLRKGWGIINRHATT